jgi:lysophospholipase L1-like esterase
MRIRGWAGAGLALVMAGCGGGKTSAPPGSPPSTSGTPPSTPGTPDDPGTPSGPSLPQLPWTTDGSGGVAPLLPAVRYTGRFDLSDPAGPNFGWPGSAIAIQFTGTSASVRLRQGIGAWLDSTGAKMQNEYDVYVDGALIATPLVTVLGQESYPIATGLVPGIHGLKLVKRTESVAGDAQFLGFVFDPKATVGSPDPLGRRIEFVGDSITAGYGVDGEDQTCPFSAQTENVDESYAALTAQALGAEVVTEAFQGKGVYRNHDGTLSETMPALYPRVLPDASAPAWDAASWTPDVVVVNLGTNDFSAGDPGEGFVAAFDDFAKAVREKRPHALIVLALGPMLSDSEPKNAHQLTLARTYLQKVVADRQAAGDTKVALVEFPSQDGSLGYGCEWHPSRATQQEMAAVLVNFLRGQLGW